MRKSSYFLVAVGLAATAMAPIGAARAQMALPALEVASGHSLVSISAEGRTIGKPDVAVFSAGVTTRGESAAAALAENSRAMARVLAELQRAGVAMRDIQTSNLSIQPVYVDPNREAMETMMAARASGQPYAPLPTEPQVPRIVGFQASNHVSVRQRDLDEFGKVIDTLAAAGANQINGPALEMDNAEPALDHARLEAIKTARARAELYAKATGLRILRILSIADGGGSYGPQPIVFGTTTAIREAAPPLPPSPSPVRPGEVQVAATVTVLYELAPA